MKKSILQEAEELIHGPRRNAYGPPRESFTRLAQLLSVTLHRKLKEPLTAHDAALVGVCLKLCRESNSPQRDNRVDGAGYFALADEVAETDSVESTAAASGLAFISHQCRRNDHRACVINEECDCSCHSEVKLEFKPVGKPTLQWPIGAAVWRCDCGAEMAVGYEYEGRGRWRYAPDSSGTFEHFHPASIKFANRGIGKSGRWLTAKKIQ